MKQGIIFDMDGTLWDSTVGVAESWNEILKQEKVNRTPLTVEDFRGIMGKTMDVIAAKFFPDMPKKERMELLDKCGEYENEYLSGHGAVLYPGVEETFAKLKEKGYDVPTDIYTVEEARDALLKLVKQVKA